mgnify:CR=1 FL=1
MEYNIIYNSLVEARQHRPKQTAKGFELHHIVPKSFGGTDSTDNLVSLTPKEHFIAHRLLVKINKGERATKMALALHRMATGAHKSGYWITARTYTYLRQLRSNAYQDWLRTPRGIAFRERQRARGKTLKNHKNRGTWSAQRRTKYEQTIKARTS